MIDAWLRLPAAGLFTVLAFAYALTGVFWAWLSFWSPLTPRVRLLTGVVGPFFSSVGLLFALLTGFLASDIAEHHSLAWRAVNNEASAITSVFNLSLAASTDMAEIRSALQAYAEAAVSDEWPKMAQDRHSALTDTAMNQLLRQASDSAITREAGQALHNNLLRAVLNIRDAQASRLALASDEGDRLNWLTVLLLGIFTQLAIALVHLERPYAQAAALSVFSLATVIALSLIAVQEHPFKGSRRLSPAPLERAISIIVPS